MKEFRFFIGSLAVIFIFTAFAFAQTPKAEKIGFVNWTAFEDENTGIKELIEANKKLDEEFEPINNELRELVEEYKKKVETIKQLTDPKRDKAGCYPTLQSFVDEIGALEVKIKAKEADGKEKYKKRREEIVGAVYEKIFKALEVFAKEKSYVFIIDVSLKTQSFCKEIEGDLITKEFIDFYNEDFSRRKE